MSYEYMSGLGDEAVDLEKFKTNQYRLRSEAFKKFGQATSSPGDPCTPPDGGFIRKAHANIPLTPEQIPVVEAQMAPILAAGCQPTGRMWDIYKAEMCCPLDTPKITYLFPLPPNFQPPAAPEKKVAPPVVMQTDSPVAPVALSPGAKGHVEAFLPPKVPAAAPAAPQPAAPVAPVAPKPAVKEPAPAPVVPKAPPPPAAPAAPRVVIQPEGPPPPVEQSPVVSEPVLYVGVTPVEAPPVTNDALEKKKYFGLTAEQLLIVGVGAVVVYALLK